MANMLQKIIYNCSIASPICIVFAIAWAIQENTYIVPIIIGSVGIGFIIAFYLSFRYGKKHLSNTSIRTTSISPNDGWIVVYIITYVLPFANTIISEMNLIVLSTIAFFIAFCVPFINIATPNPLLFFIGYHFYQIDTENGITYILISKKKYRKKQDLKVVNKVFDFLLLDKERR